MHFLLEGLSLLKVFSSDLSMGLDSKHLELILVKINESKQQRTTLKREATSLSASFIVGIITLLKRNLTIYIGLAVKR